MPVAKKKSGELAQLRERQARVLYVVLAINGVMFLFEFIAGWVIPTPFSGSGRRFHLVDGLGAQPIRRDKSAYFGIVGRDPASVIALGFVID